MTEPITSAIHPRRCSAQFVLAGCCAYVFAALGHAKPLHAEPAMMSVLYAPQQGQWVHTASLGYYDTAYAVRSQVLNHDGHSRYGLVGYGLDYGLTHATTLSVVQIYAKQLESNPNNVAQGRVGWRSPKFQVSHIHELGGHWWVKPTGGVQFNPATSSGMNYVFGAVDVAYRLALTQPTWTVAAGLIRTEHKDIDGHSQGWRIEANWEQGHHHLKLKMAETRLSELFGAQGHYDPSRYVTTELEWAYRWKPKMWLSIGYVHETNRGRLVQMPTTLEFRSDRKHQQVTLAVKWQLGQ